MRGGTAAVDGYSPSIAAVSTAGSPPPAVNVAASDAICAGIAARFARRSCSVSTSTRCCSNCSSVKVFKSTVLPFYAGVPGRVVGKGSEVGMATTGQKVGMATHSVYLTDTLNFHRPFPPH